MISFLKKLFTKDNFSIKKIRAYNQSDSSTTLTIIYGSSIEKTLSFLQDHLGYEYDCVFYSQLQQTIDFNKERRMLMKIKQLSKTYFCITASNIILEEMQSLLNLIFRKSDLCKVQPLSQKTKIVYNQSSSELDFYKKTCLFIGTPVQSLLKFLDSKSTNLIEYDYTLLISSKEDLDNVISNSEYCTSTHIKIFEI